MKEYKIYPLLNGEFVMDWGHIMSPLCSGYRDVVPIYCFLIEGPDGEFIMVDTGYDYETVPKPVFNPKIQDSPEWDLTNHLVAHGIHPDEIKTVIITHLHHDHTGNMKLFKNAEFIVQEKELLGSTYPVGVQTIGVAKEDWKDLVPKFRLTDGDLTIREGIDLVLTPGHTEGHQAVVVNTSKGKVAIMGDTCYMYGGMALRFPKQFDDLLVKGATVPGGVPPEVFKALFQMMLENGRYGMFFGPSNANPGENAKSIQKLDLMGDMILTHHDALVGKMKVIPDDYIADEDIKFGGGSL